MSQRVLCIFRPGEEVTPVLRIGGAKGLEESEDFLIGPFCLSVGLRVVTGSEVNVDYHLLHETGPDSGCEMGTPVTHNFLWDAKVAKHMLEH